VAALFRDPLRTVIRSEKGLEVSTPEGEGASSKDESDNEIEDDNFVQAAGNLAVQARKIEIFVNVACEKVTQTRLWIVCQNTSSSPSLVAKQAEGHAFYDPVYSYISNNSNDCIMHNCYAAQLLCGTFLAAAIQTSALLVHFTVTPVGK
jgi:hypothetical protein